MCPNHEVVVFQPQTGTDPYLVSVANYISYSNPPSPPVSNNFMDILISPYPTTPPSVAFYVVAPLSCNRYPSHLLDQITVHLDVACTRIPPASAARPCAPRRVPASANVSFLYTPFLFCPRPDLRSLLDPWGVRPLRVPTRLCVPTSSSWLLLHILSYSGVTFSCRVDFRKNARGQGASTP